MTKIRSNAQGIAHRLQSEGIDLYEGDFFALSQSQVEALLAEADRIGYRRPKNANGSRGRYFFAAVQRALAHGA